VRYHDAGGDIVSGPLSWGKSPSCLRHDLQSQLLASASPLGLRYSLVHVDMLIFDVFITYTKARKCHYQQDSFELVNSDLEPLVAKTTTAKKLRGRLKVHARPKVDPPPSSGCYGFA
jgi:hypothetical protein